MQQDSRTDEQLAGLFKSGEERVFDELYRRYLNPLRFYLLKISWYKDDLYIEEVLQRVMVAICLGLRAGNFVGGSFRRWAFSVARLLCYKEGEKRFSGPVLMSKQITDALPDMMPDMRPDASDEIEAHNHLTNKLEMVLSRLPANDRRLFELKNKGVPYGRILDEPEFNGLNVGRLRVRYCRILERIKDLIRKEEKK